MSLYKPIFIVGTGRCGSTIFHDVLCHHKQVAWLSQLISKYPHKPRLNLWGMSALQIPLLSFILRRKLYPSEPYSFWERYCPGFSRPFRDILQSDVTPRVEKRIRTAIENSIPDRFRFIAKITGWPRINYLQKIFPDAMFVHILRDGRAVVNSVISAPYFDGWSGPNNWTRGELNDRQHKYWVDSGKSFIILAAIGWENRMAAFDAVRNTIDKDYYLEIKYEDFCEQPQDTLVKVLDFTELRVDKDFLNKISSQYKLKSQNDKWKTDLNAEQQQLLNDYLSPIIDKYGYQ